jgi:exodeoxyribonuclease V alpha subunit
MPKESHESLETIAGTIERIIYSNDENHYTVAQLLPENDRKPITIVGNLAMLNVGETVRLTGKWTTHKDFGRQFSVEKFESVLPSTVDGIKKYLGSGLVKGIGPAFAERIVEKFGADTLRVIDEFSAKLREVDGIGPERARRIKDAWQQQRAVRDIMIFLQGVGIGTSHAAKIYKQYGDRAIVVVRENPYQLARDIQGIGFKTADAIAQRVGIPENSPHRLCAGVIYSLEQAAEDGHVCLPQAQLVQFSTQLLGAEVQPVESAIQQLALNGDIVLENDAVFLAGLHRSERNCAERLLNLRNAKKNLPPIDVEKALEWVEKKIEITLADAQRDAIRTVLTKPVTVITGGPGVGKTTIINSLVKILMAKNCRVLLAAPTGRAAKRMAETTGIAAQTIHRLLKFEPRSGKFLQNERHPLEADAVIVDETSMLDVPLASHLLRAVPNDAILVLVGDVDQLPSVGPGNFLRDVIESNAVSVVRLTEIFRQARDSLIVQNAHRVNRGEMPQFSAERDFFFIEKGDPNDALATVIELVSERIPKKFGFDALEDIQVLTPMHKGVCGSENLNRALQQKLNPHGTILQRFGRTYRVGDKVMQIKNNYDKDVFNGDLGRIARLDWVDQQIFVEMNDREIPYEFDDVDELLPAYAMSVHKSQGNEYPCVVVPLLTQHYVLLQRNLLYTAITRGKQLVVLVGDKKALAIAVRNNRTAARYSLLRERLQSCRE